MDFKIDMLQNILQDIESNKEQLKTLEQKLNESTEQIKKDYNKSELIDIANYLYWNVSAIKSTFIANNFFNIQANQLLKFIEPLKSNIKCKHCNNIAICKSRTEHNARIYEDKKEGYVCKPCWNEKHKENNKKRHEEVKTRKEHIKYLRNLPYSEYLQTDHWQSFRKKALRRATYQCSICNTNNNLHVHHRTYKNRGNENYEDVIVLCGNCHGLFHKEGKK